MRRFSKWARALYKDKKKPAKGALEQHTHSDSHSSAVIRQLKLPLKEYRKFPTNTSLEQETSRQVLLTTLENTWFLEKKNCLFSLSLVTVLRYTIFHFSKLIIF